MFSVVHLLFSVILFLSFVHTQSYVYQNVTAGQQLPLFKQRTGDPIGILRTSTGQPVEWLEATESLNSNLIFNPFFMDSLTHLLHERIPERLVHAKAAGAHGYFEVTHDITHICRAKLFQEVGKKTPITVRLSLANSNRGTSDTSRDFRGFATKFYTEDGNLDIVALNIEMFFFKDPVKFPSFAHAFSRNPQTNLIDMNARWDFVTLNPETLFAYLRMLGDRGIPDGYRYMPGFAIHAFEVENELREKHFVKFHLIPDGGYRTLTSDEARKISGEDPDYATRDLYDAIANGDFPSWTLGFQVMSVQDVKASNFDPFDVTRVWSATDYPVRPIGMIILNKNTDNFFARIEQVAFSPANLVPGIRGIDKVFEARTLAYRLTHLHRLGSNPDKIEVNCPLGIRTQPKTYNRDGTPPVKDNERDAPNYYPNSFNGPVAYVDEKRTQTFRVYTNPHVNNFDQASELYAEIMTEGERRRLVENIVTSLRDAARFLQKRAVKLLKLIHPDFGQRVEYGLMVNGSNYQHSLDYVMHKTWNK